MNKQFYYSRVEKNPVPSKEGNVQEDIIFTDSFNTDFVIRSVELEDKRRLVLLNDIHERLEKIPQFNSKKDKITGYTKERNVFQSEIYLSEDDSKKFQEFTK